MIAKTEVDRLLDAREVCEVLSCSKVTLHRRIRRGGFPRPLRLDPSNPRSRLRFRASEIAAWIQAQQLATVAAEGAAEPLSIRSGYSGDASATE